MVKVTRCGAAGLDLATAVPPPPRCVVFAASGHLLSISSGSIHRQGSRRGVNELYYGGAVVAQQGVSPCLLSLTNIKLCINSESTLTFSRAYLPYLQSQRSSVVTYYPKIFISGFRIKMHCNLQDVSISTL